MMKLGLIPGAAKKALEQDWNRTLGRLRAMGYHGLEMQMDTLEKSGLAADDCRRHLADHGFEAMSFFAGWGPFDADAERYIDTALTLGCSYMVWGWSPGEDSEQMREALPVMHKAAGMVREAGMRLIYHNHDHEFNNRVGDATGFNWLMDKFHPALLACELDIGWVAYGGRDVVETINAYPGRCPILHMRDIGDPATRGAFIEVGNGELDLAAILKAGEKVGGTEWAIVEHSEQMQCEVFDGLEVAARNIQTALKDIASS